VVDMKLPPEQMNTLIRQKFDVYTSVGWDGGGEVKFTGYYTPIFDASYTRTERFQWPLYRQPSDLAKGADGTILGRKESGGQISTYPARQEIERSNMLEGSELIWLGDPFEVYIAHVQGSARLRMTDGTMITVGYTANNGHEYVPIGPELVRDGKIAPNQLSLQTMIDYFKTHPDEVNKFTWRNPRFVFFAETQGNPRGSLNEPVTPWRTIATDKAIYPRACLAFIDTPLPRNAGGQIQLARYNGFALDQDTGGAIRAPGRCDIYMGIGDEAGILAGRTQQVGRLYYLFLKQPHGTTVEYAGKAEVLR